MPQVLWISAELAEALAEAIEIGVFVRARVPSSDAVTAGRGVGVPDRADDRSGAMTAA